ncbi:uncharacterized protein [Narcine bancroftii]|uniref:uncharacterized protein n=1 Tax=Narcine bancroftii TaxID=1343680 RepID=UPI00383180BF
MDLYTLEPKKLDDFIKRNLEPTGFKTSVKEAVHRVCEFLKNQCFIGQPNVKVIRSIKSGSSGKGTALKNNSDADLVVFLSCFSSFQDQRDNRLEILEEIQRMLKKCSESIAYEIRDIDITFVANSNIPPKSLSFEMKSKKSLESVSFDVLPTYDVLTAQYNVTEAHLKLIGFLSKNGEFSACFTELQRKFVKRYSSKVKDLIRLLKYWYKEYVKPRNSELKNGERLPAKYALELLTIYAWQQGNHQERFDTAAGFHTVLQLICNYQELCIYWTDYYDVNNATLATFLIRKVQERRPIILDPADPTNNVALSSGWWVMQDEARKCLNIPCVLNSSMWDVQPVKMFTITVTLNGKTLLKNVNIFNKVSEIKCIIQEKWNIAAPQQQLEFNCRPLTDSFTLLNSRIFSDSSIRLLVVNKIEIFVDSNNRILTIQVSPTDKVSSLKDKIKSLEQLTSKQFYLTFESRPLEDDRSLQYYGIRQHSTIRVNLRLRGGIEIHKSQISISVLQDVMSLSMCVPGGSAPKILQNDFRTPDLRYETLEKVLMIGSLEINPQHPDVKERFEIWKHVNEALILTQAEVINTNQKWLMELCTKLGPRAFQAIKDCMNYEPAMTFLLPHLPPITSTPIPLPCSIPTALPADSPVNSGVARAQRGDGAVSMMSSSLPSCLELLSATILLCRRWSNFTTIPGRGNLDHVGPANPPLDLLCRRNQNLALLPHLLHDLLIACSIFLCVILTFTLLLATSDLEIKTPPDLGNWFRLNISSLDSRSSLNQRRERDWRNSQSNSGADRVGAEVWPFRVVALASPRFRSRFLHPRKMDFMGHRLTQEGLNPADAKDKAVADAREPQNATEMSFLGLVNYCTKSKPCARIERWVLRLQQYKYRVVHIAGKAKVADPLSRLLKDGCPQSKSELETEAESFVHFIAIQSTPGVVTTREVERESGSMVTVRSPVGVLYKRNGSDVKKYQSRAAPSEMVGNPVRVAQPEGPDDVPKVVTSFPDEVARVLATPEAVASSFSGAKGKSCVDGVINFTFRATNVTGREHTETADYGNPETETQDEIEVTADAGIWSKTENAARAAVHTWTVYNSNDLNNEFSSFREQLKDAVCMTERFCAPSSDNGATVAHCDTQSQNTLDRAHIEGWHNGDCFSLLRKYSHCCTFLITEENANYCCVIYKTDDTVGAESGDMLNDPLNSSSSLVRMPKAGLNLRAGAAAPAGAERVAAAAAASRSLGKTEKEMDGKIDLLQVSPHDLDGYIFTFLQPDERFLKQVGETIDKICSFLKELRNPSIKIGKTVKGGSLGKGTALRNGSDADLVIFLNNFKCFEDQKRNRVEILITIRMLLESCEKRLGHEIIMSEPKIIPPGSSPRSLNFQFRSTESSDSIEVDVLPAFDALGQETWIPPNPWVYDKLIKTRERGGEFSTCFTELQRNFVKTCPAKLKGLIRLVKYWYTEHVRRQFKCQLNRGEFLPPKYALELLIIYAWESAKMGNKFKTAEGFRTVLELIVQYQNLWIFWTTNYNFNSHHVAEFLKDKLQEKRPVILDPADPTGNVAGNARWDLVARAASECLQSKCVEYVKSWDVQPVKSISISVNPGLNHFSIDPFSRIENIKQKVETCIGKPTSQFDLEWNGQILQEACTLSDYRIFHDVTLLLKEHSFLCILL